MKIHKKTAVLLLLLLFSASCSAEDEKTSLPSDQTENETLLEEAETTEETAVIEETPLTSDEVKEKYAEYLESILQETPEMQGYFKLVYIDEDDYPELILLTNNRNQTLDSYSIAVYTYYEGQINTVAECCTLEPTVRYVPYENKMELYVYDSAVDPIIEDEGDEERVYALEDLYNYTERVFYHIENGCGVSDKQFVTEYSESLGTRLYTVDGQKANKAKYDLEYSNEYHSNANYIELWPFQLTQYPLTLGNIKNIPALEEVVQFAEGVEEVEIVEEVVEVVEEEVCEVIEESFAVSDDIKEKYVEYLRKIQEEEPYITKYFALAYMDDDEYPEIIFTSIYNPFEPWGNPDFNYHIRVGTYFEDEIHTVLDYETSASEIYYVPRQNLISTYIGTDDILTNRFGAERAHSIVKESNNKNKYVSAACKYLFERYQLPSENSYATMVEDTVGNTRITPVSEEYFFSVYDTYQKEMKDMNCRILNNFAYKADEENLREALEN